MPQKGCPKERSNLDMKQVWLTGHKATHHSGATIWDCLPSSIQRHRPTGSSAIVAHSPTARQLSSLPFLITGQNPFPYFETVNQKMHFTVERHQPGPWYFSTLAYVLLEQRALVSLLCMCNQNKDNSWTFGTLEVLLISQTQNSQLAQFKCGFHSHF